MAVEILFRQWSKNLKVLALQMLIPAKFLGRFILHWEDLKMKNIYLVKTNAKNNFLKNFLL